MDNNKIFLPANNSKKSNNSSFYLDIDLLSNKKMFTDNNIVGTINAYDRYRYERKQSNKVRLTVNINAICSNVLFNPVTEIIRYEGSDSATSINYETIKNGNIKDKDGSSPIKPKDGDDKSFEWNSYQAVRDTQLSKDDYGFTYHCGTDIFNNHLFRNNSFNLVLYNDDKKSNIDETFNTIDDWMRNEKGEIIKRGFIAEEDGNIIYSITGLYIQAEPHIKNGVVDYHDMYCTFNINIFASKNIKNSPENTLFGKFFISDDGKNEKYEVEYHYTGFELKENKEATLLIQDVYVGSTRRWDKLNFGMDGNYSDYALSINSRIENMYNNKYPVSYYLKDSSAYKKFYKQSHLYQKNGFNSFDNSLKNNLLEVNGWFGFKNKGKIQIKNCTVLNSSKKLPIYNVINNKLNGEFIDMYPERDLFSFTPKYNEYRNRIEPNWDYCLTYPSSSTTEGISFINSEINSLKIEVFNENIKDDNGVDVITFYSVSQHGLNEGDYVNIYSDNKLIISNATVSLVYSKYIFQIYRNGVTISNKWYELKDKDTKGNTLVVDGITYFKNQSLNNVRYVETYDSKNFVYCAVPDTNKISLDRTTTNISFKKVVNGIECNYYVRIFSKIPNFKFSDTEINDKTLYDNDSTLIADYSNSDNMFESHINKLGFSKNIYGDSINEIVFTDDIDLSHLKDNLGRPLSDIYLSIFKRNKGYKKWYGIDDYGNPTECNTKDSEIEYSHCFGKNSCGFILSDESSDDTRYEDVRSICTTGKEGVIMGVINKDATKRYGADEIIFDTDKNFYGDLCYYSPTDANEVCIQPIFNRFNTAQRELTKSNSIAYKSFSSFTYDEIINDEGHTREPSSTYHKNHSEQRIYNPLTRDEGYYYKAHYKIPVKTISADLSKEKAITHTILSLEYQDDELIIYTDDVNYFSINDKFTIYDKIDNVLYNGIVSKLITDKKFWCSILDENNIDAKLPYINDISRYILLTRDDATPPYAKIIKDGSCEFYWRDVIQNGFDDNSNVEEYPFTNNALYINRNINFYLRRQDADGSLGLNYNYNVSQNNDYALSYEFDSEKMPEEIEDNYTSEENLKEC